MKFFNSKPDENLIKLLKESRQDFRFGQDQVKDRLFASMRQTPLAAPSRIFLTLRIINYVSLTACLIIFISATFTFASNSKPGDRLFALNKLGEKIILSLPLSMEQEAQVHASIVTRRLEALLEIENAESIVPEPQQPEPNPPQVKPAEVKPAETKQTRQPEPKPAEVKQARQLEARQLETVKESDEAIKDAIETVSKNKQKLERSGKKEASQKLGKILNQIDDLAKKHEEKIKSLEASVPDKDVKQSIDKHLLEIKNSRNKAGVELKSQEKKSDDSRD